ncbi:MAG: hypothetical protein GY847_01145 [Proteobacteria bacterium]|nr:hypothetical protein [Pseudomonadota bacterium]
MAQDDNGTVYISYGPGGAAEILNVNPRTLQYRMRKLGIPFGRSAKGIY